MLIDNCSAHPGLEDKLEVTKLVFFPPNTTSVLQPMDQRIIQAIKSQYRRRIVDKLLTSIGDDGHGDLPTITLQDAVSVVSSAWKSVSPETIDKWFRRAGFEKQLIPTLQCRVKSLSQQKPDQAYSRECENCFKLNSRITRKLMVMYIAEKKI